MTIPPARLKTYRDLKNSLDTAHEEGIEVGIEIGIRRVVIRGLQRGLDDATLLDLTGITPAQLEQIKRNFNDQP